MRKLRRFAHHQRESHSTDASLKVSNLQESALKVSNLRDAALKVSNQHTSSRQLRREAPDIFE